MALFGKKETEEKLAGIQAPPVEMETSREQKKTQKKAATKGSPSAAIKETSQDTTYLGKNLKINGSVSGEGNLILMGTFDGDFDLKGQLKVAQGSVIKGDIKATGVSVNGNVDGTIVATEKILLDTTAAMKGRLVTPKVSIQDGAVFDGELQMSNKEAQPPKPVVPEVKQPTKPLMVSEIK
jgi:cytoskeletal protein CcmA (bactofilin family)